MAQDSAAFLAQYMHSPVAIENPAVAVRPGYAAPFFPTQAAYVLQALPAHGVVAISPTISDRERAQLSEPATGFFQNIMRPTIKHV